jgi:hypothetical protein
MVSETGVRLEARYLIASFALMALISFASASGPGSGLKAYLSPYMSNATISQFSYYNLTVNGSSYVVAVAANGTYLTIANVGGKFALGTNATAIDPVLTAYYAQYSNLSAVSYLNTAMHKYYNNIAANVTDCITETGVSPPYTNVFQNAVLGCSSIPNCNRALTSSFGAESPFGFGLQNFSIDEGVLNTSLNSYFSTLKGINATNAGNKLAILTVDIANISTISTELPQNPLFPPPLSANFANCNGGGISTQQPWYCVAVGYCGYLSFNTTLLGSISSTVQQLEQKIPSQAALRSYSSASAQAASSYILQANQKANSVTYQSFLNATYPKYNATVAAAAALLAKSPNANLTASIASLKASMAAILSNGVNVSISSEAAGFNSVLSTTITKYNAANLSFAEASSYSSNYTLSAIAAQLNYRHTPPKLAALASQLEALDLQIGSGGNSTEVAAALPQLKVIGLQLGIYVPLTTMGYLVKVTDGWFINAALAGSNAAVQSKINAAPTYAALLSFIIGLIILILIYLFTHRRLSKRHKLRRDKRTNLVWTVFFVGLFVVLLIYTYATYAFAQAGNTFIPFAYFHSYLQGSKSAYIVLNGSAAYSNSGITSCAGAIASLLTSQGKAVKTIQATNYSCVAGGTVSSLGVDCIDKALSAGTPVISLSSSGSGIVHKGLYGTMLYASGSNATGSSCIVAQLLARK